MDATPNNTNPQPDPYIGKEIDKYILIEPLGKGGMGIVYKAKHKNIKRFAALKFLTGPQAYDEVSIKRLEREASAMGSLQHPNIATMYDFGISKEAQPYIVLELIEGKNLNEIFRESKYIDPINLVSYFIQISGAMDYAHKKGLIHRDLKPGNIMITEAENEVKILDFGIARSTEESMMLTKTGQIMGSAAYMSPEQCTGKKQVDFRTDIYALGVMMYQLITGKLPYKGDSFLQTIFLKTTEHPEPFPENTKELKGLESLTLRCLMADPDDRPESMHSIKEELEKIISTKNTRIDNDETIVTAVNTDPDNDTKELTAQRQPQQRFTKSELDAIASDTTKQITVNIKEENNEPAIDKTLKPTLSETFIKEKLIIPIVLMILTIVGFITFNSLGTKDTIDVSAEKEPPQSTTKAQESPDLLETQKNTVKSTGAAKTDSLMSTPIPIAPVKTRKTSNTSKRQYSQSRLKKTTPPRTTRSAKPPIAPPVVQKSNPIYTAPQPVPSPAPQPIRRRTSNTRKPLPVNASTGKEIKKSIKHNYRKGKELIRKFKKIF